MIVSGTVGGKEVTITFNGEDRPCHLMIQITHPFEMVMMDADFKNPKMLSASLRGELGYLDSCKILYRNGVGKDSALWDLNHDGYPNDEFIGQFL